MMKRAMMALMRRLAQPFYYARENGQMAAAMLRGNRHGG